MEVTTMHFVLEFLTRIFEVGAFVTIFFVVAALLESEVVGAGSPLHGAPLLARITGRRRKLPMSSLDKPDEEQANKRPDGIHSLSTMAYPSHSRECSHDVGWL